MSFNILDLPDEIQIRFLSFLPPLDLLYMTAVCWISYSTMMMYLCIDGLVFPNRYVKNGNDWPWKERYGQGSMQQNTIVLFLQIS